MTTVVIGVGSNSPDKQQRMNKAIYFLRDFLGSFRCSSVYSTPALNGVDADYLNAVVCGSCETTPEQIVNMLKDYERSCGRNKDDDYVVIDLDLVIADGKVLRPHDMERDYFLRGYRELIGE